MSTFIHVASEKYLRHAQIHLQYGHIYMSYAQFHNFYLQIYVWHEVFHCCIFNFICNVSPDPFKIHKFCYEGCLNPLMLCLKLHLPGIWHKELTFTHGILLRMELHIFIMVYLGDESGWSYFLRHRVGTPLDKSCWKPSINLWQRTISICPEPTKLQHTSSVNSTVPVCSHNIWKSMCM